MDNTVSDFLLARLRDWGVHRIFGYPGDGAMQMNGMAEFVHQKLG